MKISTREKRLLIIGGSLTILVLVYYLATLLIPSREDSTTSAEFKKRFLLRQKETINLEEGYAARIAQYELRLKQDLARLLPGDSPAAAAATLQKVLQEMADASGVEITSKTMQQDQKTQESLMKISVQMNTTCTIDELVRFMAAIESYEKFLKVEELNIQTFRIRNRDEIRPQIKVVGYVASPSPPAKAAEKANGGN